MENILTIAIVTLAISDIVLNFKLLNPWVSFRARRDEKIETVALIMLQKALERKLKLNLFQAIIRFLLMAAWVMNSFYHSQIAFICFIVAVLYSLTFYSSASQFKEAKAAKTEYDAALEIMKMMEIVEDQQRDDSNEE